MTTDLLTTVKAKAQQWLTSDFDAETQKQVKDLLQNNEKELIDSFYQNLEFGTGGLRGIMGVGINRMNIYTVGMATQGLANYLLKEFANKKEISAVIAYDSRNNSRLFAEYTARVFIGNGIKAYVFDDIRPTPELSFAIRQLGCQTGVVVTASHNPKEYNGYKAYWEHGGQVIAPHDTNIIDEVKKIATPKDVKVAPDNAKINYIGSDIDAIYLEKLLGLSLSPEIIKQNSNMSIVYTPIHGTGVKLVPAILKKFGFTNIHNVPEQDISDGNFPTVHSPNPEESAALDMAIQKAKKINADIVLATDPDADRVGIAVKNSGGEFVLLNGNQIATLLIHYLLTKWNEKGKLKGKEYIVKTIVTTELLADIAAKFDVKCYDVLTGFKYIADIINTNFGKTTFIGGGEESYGYLMGEFVRDKDAVIASAMIAETMAWAKSEGKSLFDLLIDIYIEYGLYKEALVNIVRKGKDGQEEIKKMMADYRSSPPQTINGSKVVLIHDFQNRKTYDLISDLKYDIELPKSDVLQFITADGTKISVRPSGTEPKIKFYIGVKETLDQPQNYEKVLTAINQKIENIKKDLAIA